MTHNPWKTLGSKRIYENPWFSVRADDVIRPDGEPGIYHVVTAERLALGILPLRPDQTLTLVGQFRYPIGEYSWETPEDAGQLERLARYVTRPPLAADSIRRTNNGMLEITTPPDPRTGATVRSFDRLDRVQNITAHIPDRGRHCVRYYVTQRFMWSWAREAL